MTARLAQLGEFERQIYAQPNKAMKTILKKKLCQGGPAASLAAAREEVLDVPCVQEDCLRTVLHYDGLHLHPVSLEKGLHIRLVERGVEVANVDLVVGPFIFCRFRAGCQP